MKKLFSVLLSALVLVTLMAACSNDAPASSAPAESTPAPASSAAPVESTPASTGGDDLPAAQGVDGKTVGITIYKFDDNFMTLYRTELERYLVAGGATVQVMDGKNDQAEQTNQINNFISQGVDVMIINLVMSSSAPTIADICHDAGIPAVFINREPDKEEQARWVEEGMQCTYVGADASQSGTFQGELIADLDNNGDADGDGVVRYAMIQGDPENIDAQLRTEYSVKALVDAGIEVEELFMQRGDWDQIKGQELAANALSAHGDKLDVIFCNNDAMALGAIQAIQAAGRTVGKDIYLVGVDALVDALEAIQAGTMTGTVFNDHLSQARTAADKASDFINGVAVPEYVGVDYVKVTPDNVDEILALVA